MARAGITWRFGGAPRAETLAALPPELAAELEETNGWVQFGGGLHVRGSCEAPDWHSLEATWTGPGALHHAYPVLLPTDVPWGQDCLGDQFLLRDGEVIRLVAEAGEIERTGRSLAAFLADVEADPVEVLSMGPLLALREAGGLLEPGQLVHAYPPYLFDAEGPRSHRAIPAASVIAGAAGIARQLRGVPDGTRVVFRPGAPPGDRADPPTGTSHAS